MGKYQIIILRRQRFREYINNKFATLKSDLTVTNTIKKIPYNRPSDFKVDKIKGKKYGEAKKKKH